MTRCSNTPNILAKHPKVRPSLEEVEKAQGKFDFTEMVNKAVEGTTMKVFELS